MSDDTIDPAADVLCAEDRAQCHDVAHRQVQHQAAAAVRAAMRSIGDVRVRRGLELTELGLVGDELDRAAHRARAVQRALRAAQRFHMVQIKQVGIDDGTAVERNRRRGQRRLVEVKAYRGRGAAARRKPPHLILGLTGTRTAERKSGYLADHILNVVDAFCLQVADGERRDADGGRLYR